jgi:nicotinate-nucleotide adenylyltransferase
MTFRNAKSFARVCMGGSFDPIHVGHRICARFAAEAIGADRVILLPARQSPHKARPADPSGDATMASGKGSGEASDDARGPSGVERQERPSKPATPADRLAMLRLAVAGDALFEVDPRELYRPPPSYTFDTVSELLGESDRPIVWIVGTDHLPRLQTWHRFDELVGLIRFVVMRRAGESVDRATLDPRVRPLVDAMVDVPAIGISSTLVRSRAGAGQSLDGLVEPAVARYILDHQLYHAAKV